MNLDSYRLGKEMRNEALDALEVVAETSSPDVGAGACRRALQLCCMIDQEVNGTEYPSAFEPAEWLQCFLDRHPNVLPQESSAAVEEFLQSNMFESKACTADTAEDLFENTLLPVCRSMRTMLETACAGLRRPHRHGPLFRAAMITAAVAAIALIPSLKMMLSRNGLTVTYYRGTALDKPLRRSIETQICTDYGTARPALLVPTDRFSARWKGKLIVPATTNYAFFCQRDGGVRVYIDDNAIVDDWQDKPWKTSGIHSQALLEAGKHTIVVEYYKNTGRGRIRLRWAGGPIPGNTIVAVPYLKR